MSNFADPTFSVPVILGVVAVVLAGYALMRQKRDRTVSVATYNLVSASITSQEESRKQGEVELKKTGFAVQIALIFLGIILLGIVLLAVSIKSASKTEDRTSLVST